MTGVSGNVQTSSAGRCLEEHAVVPRIGRLVGDAVLIDVNLDPRTQRFAGYANRLGFVQNLLDGKISLIRAPSVKRRGGEPDFVGHFDWLYQVVPLNIRIICTTYIIKKIT